MLSSEIIPILLVAVAAITCRAAPSTYDQRQDGDVNVKVDLDNFVILIARPSSPLSIFSSMSQLLPDSKSSPVLGIQSEQQQQADVQVAKSADPEELKLNEEKPNQKEIVSDAAAAATTVSSTDQPSQPKLNEEKEEEEMDKSARSLEDQIAKSLKGFKAKSATGKYKFVESVEEPQSLKLIGDAVENCGPGRSRDRLGICQENVTQ